MNRLIRRYIYALLLPFIWRGFSMGQEQGNFYIKNYSVQDFNAEAWNEDIIQDKRGVIYVGNYSGCVLEFDGVSWRSIPVTNKGNETGTFISLKQDSTGRIFVGSYGEFGFLEPDLHGMMVYRSMMDLVKEEDKNITEIYNIEVLGKDIYFRSIERLFRLRDGKITAFSNPYGWFGQVFTLDNQVYVTTDFKGIILRLKGDSLVKVFEGKEFINTRFGYSVDFSTRKKLIGNDKGIYLFWCETGDGSGKYRMERFTTESDDEITGGPLHVYSIRKDLFAIGSWTKGYFIIDAKGENILNINEQSGLISSHINYLLSDNHHSLWSSSNRGISRADITLPLSYWHLTGEPDIVMNIVRYHGKIYFDTFGDGFYCLKNNKPEIIGKDIYGPLVYHEPADNARTHLLVFSHNAMFEIINDKVRKIMSFPKELYYFDLHISTLYPDRVFIRDTEGLYLIRFERGKWIWEGNIDDINDNIQSMAEDQHGNLWLSLNNRRGMIRLVPESGHPTDGLSDIRYKKQFFDSQELVSATWIRGFRVKDRMLFGTDKGLWRFDEITQKFLPDSSLGNQFCDGSHAVYFLIEGQNGEIFISGRRYQTDNTGLCIPQTDGSYRWYAKPFNGLPTQLKIANALAESNGTIWLATDNGLIKYDPELDKHTPGKFNTLIREVRTENDSILFHGTFYTEVTDIGKLSKIKIVSLHQPEFMKPLLRYRHNSIIFRYAAVSFIRKSENVYQYKLEGLDTEWSSWTFANVKEYTHLPEGKYIFHVRGRNVFGVVSDETYYGFTILPPWYRTVWSYFGFALTAVLLIYFIVLYSIRGLKASNLLLEKTVNERTKEITHQNSLLRQQKEEILSINESLQQQKEKLKAALENLCATQAQLIESGKLAALGSLVAGVAHEINTPVGIGVTASSSLLVEIQKMEALFKKNEISRKDFKEFLVEAHDATQLIQKNMERTAELVQRFKQVSADQLSEHQRVFRFKPYLCDIVQSLSPKYKQMELAFEIDCDDKLELNSYPGAYAQIFSNLLLNSLTHGFHGKMQGKITIRVRIDNNLLIIEYKDDGIGILKKDLPHIFEPFYTSDKRMGIGLGLNIVYNLIKQKLNGNITCKSESGKGALFIVEVPV